MRSRRARAFFLIGMVPVIAMILFPYAMMLSGALKGPDEIVWEKFTLLPRRPLPSNFIQVFREMPLARFFLNSVIVATGCWRERAATWH